MKKIFILALIIINLNGDVTNLTNKSKNQITATSEIKNSSTVKQGSIDVDNSSTIENVVIGKDDSINLLRDSSIDSSTVEQGVTNVNNSSLLIETVFYSNSELKESEVKNGSTIKQNGLEVTANGVLENSSFTLSSTIDNAIINGSNISQNEIEVENGIIDGLTMVGTHTIHSDTQAVSILNSDVTQGQLSIIGSSLTNSTINMSSDIDHSDISGSTVDLCSVHISNGSSIDELHVNGTCGMSGNTITDANVAQGVVAFY